MRPNHGFWKAGGARAALLFTLVGVLGAMSLPAWAQTALRDSTRAGPTRSQLEALATQSEREAESAGNADTRAEKRMEAARIRARLRDGDFQVGDRIALLVHGDTTLGDTVTVRAGRTIRLRGLPDISLQGVLHSELQEYLTKQIGQYVRDPEVEATSLLQVAVLGSVGRPGFYSVPTDMTLSDIIMLAGGPTQGGDVNRTQVRRDNKVEFKDKAVRQAFASGTTLDQMNLRTGDQIVVGEQKRSDWLRVLQVGSLAAGILVSIYALSRR